MRSYVGPDSSSVELAVELGDQNLKIVSWHEVIDESKTFATATGLVGLKGRDPNHLLAQQPAEYRRFHANWTWLRTSVDTLLPKPGNAVAADASVDDVLNDPR